MTQHCANCHQPLGDIHPYTVKIELFPRVEDSLQISEDDLQIDFTQELQSIIEQMEAMSEEERQLQEERVYSVFTFELCPRCRDLLARQLRRAVQHPPDEPS